MYYILFCYIQVTFDQHPEILDNIPQNNILENNGTVIDTDANLLEEEFEFQQTEDIFLNNKEDFQTPLELPLELEDIFDWTKTPISEPIWEDIPWVEKDITWQSKLPDPPLDVESPFYYFKMFLDDSIIKNCSEQTNLYSAQSSGTSLNTTPQEIEQYFGIHMFMSIIKMPSYRMFWSDNTRFPPVFETMPRNRYDVLRTNFHISDNDLMLPRDNPLHDKLFKIRPFIESVRTNFTFTYVIL